VSIAGDVVGAAGQKKKGKTNPMLLLAGAAGMALVAYMYLSPEDDQRRVEPAEYPKLWEQSAPVCEKSSNEAIAFANEKRMVADGKRERRMFHVKDGVDAVPLYETASACYEKANDKADAITVTDIANSLRRELDDDYRTHRMRLQHAMLVSDFETARREVRTLIDMTEGKEGPYVTYLHVVERDLKQKLGRPS
jgi:hypothetical protein